MNYKLIPRLCLNKTKYQYFCVNIPPLAPVQLGVPKCSDSLPSIFARLLLEYFFNFLNLFIHFL